MRLALALAICGLALGALDLALDLEPFADWALTGALIACLLLAARHDSGVPHGPDPRNPAKI